MQLSTRQRFVVSTLANLVVWTFVALAAADVLIGEARREGNEVGWGHVLGGQLRVWLPMVLATWIIFRASRRLHRTGASARRTIFCQVAVWIGWTVIYTLYLVWPVSDLGAWIPAALARRGSLSLWFDTVIYLAVVGFAYISLFYRGYTEQARKAAELREQLTRVELTALRARLDPHFLFNSLNTIAALVRTRDSPGALAAVARLSDLLRATLARRDRTWVRLDDELEVEARLRGASVP